MADAILDCSDEARTEDFTDDLIAQAHTKIDVAAALYSATGVPLLIVMRFRTACLKALRDRAALMSRAASAGAGGIAN